MIFAKYLIAVLWAAFLFLQVPAALAEEGFSASVAQCIDGDTFALDTDQRVRLAGVDTPEKRPEPQYYAKEAADFTCSQVRGKQIRVIPLSTGAKGKDRYQRLVAEVRLPDGASLNELLLRQGMASFYAHKELPAPLVKRLSAAQREALDKRAGCWAFVLTQPQAKEPYVGNPGSKRFFSEPCLKKVPTPPRRQVRFENLEAAFRAGYAPVRACAIWPAAK